VRPYQEFARSEASGGLFLLACTLIALVWANSPWRDSYFHLWGRELAVDVAGLGIKTSLHHWINDGLMAVFFFLVGLEIKREVLVGELASPRRAALPIAAALGGMLVPASLYALVNAGTESARGWGIPMATDIAFALGVLALLGSRVPPSLKVFLAALAIADDIGAVLVIAIFYTGSIDWSSLGLGAVMLVLLVAANLAGVRRPAVYVLLGIVLWIAFLDSGVHATVAGVLLALTIPARTRIRPDEFLARSRAILDVFEKAGVVGKTGKDVLCSRDHLNAIHELEEASEQAQAPLLRLEDKLHGVVAFGIMPLFALANAGVRLTGDLSAALASPVALGIVLGLVIGKPLGITVVSWLAVKVRVADLPSQAGWAAIHGVSWLGGIGFTMSLFIAGLAFEGSRLLDAAKLGILSASLFAGLAGWLLLWRMSAAARERG